MGLQTINLVFSNMYGPGDHFDEERSHAVGGLVMRFLEAKERGAPEVIVWGSGAPVREWLYVDDAAEAMVRAMTCAPCDQPINVGIGKACRLLMSPNAFDRLSITTDELCTTGPNRTALLIKRSMAAVARRCWDGPANGTERGFGADGEMVQKGE